MKSHCTKEKNNKNTIPNKCRHQVWNGKVEIITRSTHSICRKKYLSMVMGRFMNVFGSGYEFCDKDSYRVCSKLLHIFQVNNCGELLLAPPSKNYDYLTCMIKEDSDDSSTADREVGSLKLMKCSRHRDNFLIKPFNFSSAIITSHTIYWSHII